MTWRIFLLAVLLSCVAGLALSEPPAGTWKQIDDDAGIKVWRLEIPGVEMPGFRGEAVIDAPAERIVAVLKQVDHHTEWMKNCAASETIKRFDDDHEVIYNLTDVPWPVWDRDAILDTQFTYEGDKITLRFANTDPALRPLPDRVVRMPKLVGSYQLTKLGPSRTRVLYTVEADIGGSVPAWLARRVTKEMPYETLDRLRARVTASRS